MDCRHTVHVKLKKKLVNKWVLRLRHRWRPPVSSMRWILSTRYYGARPWRHLQTATANLKSTHSGDFDLCVRVIWNGLPADLHFCEWLNQWPFIVQRTLSSHCMCVSNSLISVVDARRCWNGNLLTKTLLISDWKLLELRRQGKVCNQQCVVLCW